MADRAPPTDVSPLYLAAKSGQVALVRYILERGLNGVDERNDKVGSTVLMCAAKSGAIDVLKLLLQKTTSLRTPPLLNHSRTQQSPPVLLL